MNTLGILDVWPRFKHAIESHLNGGCKVGMVLAWTEKGSNYSKIFNVTKVKYSGVLEIPNWVKYFCNPCKIIESYNNVLSM